MHTSIVIIIIIIIIWWNEQINVCSSVYNNFFQYSIGFTKGIVFSRFIAAPYSESSLSVYNFLQPLAQNTIVALLIFCKE